MLLFALLCVGAALASHHSSCFDEASCVPDVPKKREPASRIKVQLKSKLISAVSHLSRLEQDEREKEKKKKKEKKKAKQRTHMFRQICSRANALATTKTRARWTAATPTRAASTRLSSAPIPIGPCASMESAPQFYRWIRPDKRHRLKRAERGARKAPGPKPCYEIKDGSMIEHYD